LRNNKNKKTIMINLKIISSTVRPGRKGPLIAEWVANLAEETGDFNVEVVDLGEVNLPMMNEPHHPMQRKYVHEHTKSWSSLIDSADAFIFITAEYDYNYPAPLRNALEYLYYEWAYKAAGIVSYGGVSAGTRASNNLKADLSTFRIVPLAEGISFPFYSTNINEAGEFKPGDASYKAAETMLRELVRWTKGLKLIKENSFEFAA